MQFLSPRLYQSLVYFLLLAGLWLVLRQWRRLQQRKSQGRDDRPAAVMMIRLIRTRLGFSLAVLLILYILIFMGHQYSERQQQLALYQKMALYDAQRTADNLSQEIRVLQSQLQVLVQDRAIILNQPAGWDALRTYHRLGDHYKPWVRGISRVSAEGKLLWTTPDEARAGADLSAQPHQQAMIREHRPLVSDPFMAVQGYQAIALLQPIFDGTTFAGSLALLLDMEAFNQQYIKPTTTAGLSLALMFDAEAHGLFCSEKLSAECFRKVQTKEFRDTVRQLLANSYGSGRFRFDRADGRYRHPVDEIYSYARVPLTADHHWIVAVTARAPEIIAQAPSFSGFAIYLSYIFAVITVLVMLLRLRYEQRHAHRLRHEVERKQTELQCSELRFAQVFERTAAGLLLLDAEGNALRANGLLSQWLGFAQADTLQYNLWQDRGWDHALLRPLFEQALEGQIGMGETIHLSTGPNPHLVQLCLNVYPIEDTAQRSPQVLLVLYDISERKRAEDRLQRINRALLTLSGCNKALVRATDEAGLLRENCRILTAVGGYRLAWVGLCDPAGGPLTVVAQAGVDEGHIDFAFPQGEPGPVQRALERRERLVVPDVMAAMLESSHGPATLELDDLSLIILPLLGEEKPLGVLCVYSTEPEAFDDQEIRLLEELSNDLSYGLSVLRARAEHDRLARSRQLLATAVHQAKEAIFITDQAGLIHYSNPAFSELTGVMAEAAVGMHPRELCLDQENDSCRSAIQALQGAQGWNGQCIIRRHDGGAAEVEAMISAVRVDDGHVTNHVAVCRDVTQEHLLEEQLRQSQKMEAIGKLAGGIAHDFNNILNGIMGNIQMAHILNTGKAQKYMKEALRAGERATSLVRQLLTFSRKATGQRTPVELRSLVQEVHSLVEKTFDQRLKIVLQGEDPCTVMADPNQLHQVLMNLCVNGRDAILSRLEDGVDDARPGQLTIALAERLVDEAWCRQSASARPGRFAELAVTDNGIGMTPQTQARIFDPFFTTKGEGQGTGLGLSTVYGIVKAHQGWIEVQSQPGVGTTFKVYLPQQPTTPAPDSNEDDEF